MSSLFFGILIGILISFSGSRLLKVVITALRERKEDGERKAEEKLQTMISKVMGELKEKR